MATSKIDGVLDVVTGCSVEDVAICCQALTLDSAQRAGFMVRTLKPEEVTSYGKVLALPCMHRLP